MEIMASSRSRTPGQSSGPNRGSGRPQSEGRVLRSRATLAAAVFGLLLIVVGVAAYAGRDKGSDTQVGAGGTVPTKGETVPTLVAAPTTTVPPFPTVPAC